LLNKKWKSENERRVNEEERGRRGEGGGQEE
jgi:hypothetical protein